ncbi:hypothetical protein K435DRAFT_591811, partial [Dendrothele bispora CBS 962.96]
LVQLRTGHIPLRKHLHRICRADTPICPCCRRHPETVHHFLLRCPAHATARQRLRTEIGSRRCTTQALLTQKKLLPALFDYINATERFTHQYGTL